MFSFVMLFVSTFAALGPVFDVLPGVNGLWRWMVNQALEVSVLPPIGPDGEDEELKYGVAIEPAPAGQPPLKPYMSSFFRLRFINHRSDRKERIIAGTMALKKRRLWLWRKTVGQAEVRDLSGREPEPLAVEIKPMAAPIEIECSALAMLDEGLSETLPCRSEIWLELEMVGPIRRRRRRLTIVDRPRAHRWWQIIRWVREALAKRGDRGAAQEAGDQHVRSALGAIDDLIIEGHAILDLCGRPREQMVGADPLHFQSHCVPRINKFSSDAGETVRKWAPEFLGKLVNTGNVTHGTDVKPAMIQQVERWLENLGQIQDSLRSRLSHSASGADRSRWLHRIRKLMRERRDEGHLLFKKVENHYGPPRTEDPFTSLEQWSMKTGDLLLDAFGADIKMEFRHALGTAGIKSFRPQLLKLGELIDRADQLLLLDSFSFEDWEA